MKRPVYLIPVYNGLKYENISGKVFFCREAVH